MDVGTFSIAERVAELKREIELIYQQDLNYKKQGRRRSAQDIAAHDQRMQRMRQILEEIAKLTGRPTP